MEEMIYKIAQIVYDKTKNNQFLDMNDIEKISEIYSNNFDLKSYILDIKNTNLTKKTLGCYTLSDKAVKIDFNQIKLYYSNNSIMKELKESNETFSYINLAILKVILHELNHAYQFKYTENEVRDLKKILLLASFCDKNHRALYVINPSERMANIDSSNMCIDIFKLENFKNYKKTINYIKGVNIINKFEAYKFYNNPSLEYLNRITKTRPNINKKDLIKLYKELSKDLNTDDKLYYGTKLSIKENYKTCKKEIIKEI